MSVKLVGKLDERKKESSLAIMHLLLHYNFDITAYVVWKVYLFDILEIFYISR
jgi:hypothetical protein